MSGDIKRLSYSIKETAEALGVPEEAVIKLTESGELPSIRIEGEILIPVGKLKTWLNSRSAR